MPHFLKGLVNDGFDAGMIDFYFIKN